MNIPAVSNLVSQWAIKSVANAKKVAEQNQSFLIQEEPEPASEQASPRFDESSSTYGIWKFYGKPATKDELRYVYNWGCIPPMVNNIITPGDHSEKNEKPYKELWDIVWQYYKDVREEFGCSTSDYMPHMYGFPEYDPAIEKAMRDSLYKKVIDNPVCERLIKTVGGIFPPPDHLDFKTMCSNFTVSRITPTGVEKICG